MKNKGFILTEALIVSTVVLATLVFIYTQFAKINKNYGDSYLYDNINGIYNLNQISTYLEEEDIYKMYGDIDTNLYMNITDCNLDYYTNKDYCQKIIEYAKIKNLFITFNDKKTIYQEMSKTNDYSLKLLSYLKTMDDSDIEYNYRLVGEFMDGTFASIPIGRASVMLGSTWFDDILSDGINKDDIKSITTSNYLDIKTSYNKAYDISVNKNGKVLAYLTDNADGYYDIIIASNDYIYASPDSSYLFYDFTNLNNLDLSYMNTIKVVNMASMFRGLGRDSDTLTINLGDNFYTNKVVDMNYMFKDLGYTTNDFSLDLGPNFDTSNVLDMSSMFCFTGYNTNTFNLDLGSNFNTSSVTNMKEMFHGLGYMSKDFNLLLGSSFDTSNVLDMSSMFLDANHHGTNNFILDLGSHFNTSHVTNMKNMFAGFGMDNTSFTLNLGSSFDTSNVVDMYRMFYNVGSSSSSFNLNLGPNFNTSKVENIEEMFSMIGNNTTNLVLDLSTFNFNKVTSSNNFISSDANITIYVKDENTKDYLTFLDDNIEVLVKD